ncbi:DUF11 domain-containing protein [Nonomuraea typhae]|uniref:DUF11 domain-containing protein n=1 Tax=Nonomuraea typhae TaxID=2603600 RepID=UPI0012F86323|nr:DUF11 domain-containing protein [Nonomuraea typhae]
MRRKVFAGFMGVMVAGTPAAAHAGDGWGSADLSVRLSAEPAVAQPGHPIIYRAEVRNAGPGDAVLPVLTVTLPADVEIVSVDVATCRPGAVAHEVVCPSPADVLAGGRGGVTVTGIVRPGARGPLISRAALVSEVRDENESDNTHTLQTRVDEGADLSLRLSGRARGSRYALSALVRNQGPRMVRDARIFLRTGPARLVSAVGARCRGRVGYVSCRLRAVASGERLRVRLSLWAPDRPVNARANVYSSRFGDRRPADNRARMRIMG